MSSIRYHARLLPVLVVSLLPAWCAPQRAAQPETSPVIRSSSTEVVLDLIVRDKKGRFIRDLKPDEIEVTEEGAKENLTSFRLVERNEGAEPEAKSASGSQRPLDPLRQVRLVTFVFERLGVDGRRLSRQAALDLLKNETGDNLFFAVFTIDQRLGILQPFTSDRDAIRKAIDKATSGSYSQFGGETDSIRSSLERSAGTAGYSDQISANSGSRGPGNVNGGAMAAQKMAEMQLSMLQFADMMIREQQGRSSIFSLLSVVKEQYRLPGRKTLLYFSEGLQVPANLVEQFHSVISAANRSNVSVYAIDARGLVTSNQNQGANSALSDAMNASQAQQRAAISNRKEVTPEQARIFDTAETSLRANVQSTLAELADSTGGFLVANSNDLRTPLRRVSEEIDSYYEATYTPDIAHYDGSFRKIAVHVRRADARVQTRNGYFALPPTVSGALFPYEVPLLRVLDTKPLPKAVPLHAGAVRFTQTPHGTKCAVVIEVPLKDIVFSVSKPEQIYRVHLSVLALLKDSKGEVVQKFSKDVPVEGNLDKMASAQEGNFIYSNHLLLAPGRYTLEAAVVDQQGNHATGRKMSFLVPVAQGLDVSGITLVRRITPTEGEPDPADPFQTAKGKIVPTLTSTVPGGKDSSVSAYFVVRPDPAASGKPEASVEFYQENKLVAKGALELPAPDANGIIPYVATTSISNFAPGTYEMRVIVRQNGKQVAENTVFDVVQ